MYRTAIIYLGVAGFCGLFSIVYEANSHGVYSGWMIFLFAWPLMCGALPYALIARFNHVTSPHGAWGRLAHHGAVATATVGACLTGVFQIYGTSSEWVSLYWAAAVLLAVIAGVLGLSHGHREGGAAGPETGAVGVADLDEVGSGVEGEVVGTVA